MTFSPRRLQWMYLNHDAGFVGGIILILLGSILLAIGVIALTYETRFLNQGAVTNATILRKWESASLISSPPPLATLFAHGGGRRQKKFFVSFHFQDDQGKNIHGQASLAHFDWARLQHGSTLKVEYLKNKPEVNRPAQWISFPLWGGIGLEVAGVALLILGISLLRRRIAYFGNQIDILENGSPLLGTIVEVREERNRKGGHVGTQLVYRFPRSKGDNSNTWHIGNCRALGKTRKSWQTGDYILIVIDPEEPHDHVVDIFGVRIADLSQLVSEQNGCPISQG